MNAQSDAGGAGRIRARLNTAAGERVESLLRWLRLTSGAQQEIAALDGLRALAVLLVVGYHVQEVGAGDWPLQRLPFVTGMFDFGFIGVLLFFVLSGFLLFLPYARALVGRRPWPSPIQFYRRRALRIVPLYYAVLAIAGVGAAVTGELRGWVIKGLALDFLFLQNLSPSAGHLNGALDPPCGRWLLNGSSTCCCRGLRWALPGCVARPPSAPTMAEPSCVPPWR